MTLLQHDTEGYCRTADLPEMCFKYMWRIDGFRKELNGPDTLQSAYERTSDMREDCLKSKEFEIDFDGDITRWRLRIFVDGQGLVFREFEMFHQQATSSSDRKRRQRSSSFDEPTPVDVVSVYLESLNDEPVRANLRLSIIDNIGKRRWKGELQRPNQFDSSTMRKDIGWAVIPHSALLSDPTLLPLDSLTIMGEVTPIKGARARIGTRRNYMSPMSSDLYNISQSLPWSLWMSHPAKLDFDSPDFSDVTIFCEGEGFECHKAFLSAWSLHWKKLFKETAPEQRRYEERDARPEVVEAALRYLYTGKIPPRRLAHCVLRYANIRNLARLKSLQEAVIIATLDSIITDQDRDHCLDCLEVGLEAKSRGLVRRAAMEIFIDFRSFCKSREHRRRLVEVCPELNKVALDIPGADGDRVVRAIHRYLMSESAGEPKSEEKGLRCECVEAAAESKGEIENGKSERETGEDTVEMESGVDNDSPMVLQPNVRNSSTLKRKREQEDEAEDDQNHKAEAVDGTMETGSSETSGL